MEPGKLDLTWVRGDTYSRTMRLRSRVPDTDHPGQYVPGDYLDLTGYVGHAQLRYTFDTVEAATDLVVTIPTDTPETRGTVRVSIAQAPSQALKAHDYRWDLKLTDTAAATETYVEGVATVQPTATLL